MQNKMKWKHFVTKTADKAHICDKKTPKPSPTPWHTVCIYIGERRVREKSPEFKRLFDVKLKIGDFNYDADEKKSELVTECLQ
jgi:hypothetical protein